MDAIRGLIVQIATDDRNDQPQRNRPHCKSTERDEEGSKPKFICKCRRIRLRWKRVEEAAVNVIQILAKDDIQDRKDQEAANRLKSIGVAFLEPQKKPTKNLRSASSQ